MSTKLICDVCKKEKDKKELIYIIAYPKVKINKSGYKSLLNKDICKECYKRIFGGYDGTKR